MNIRTNSIKIEDGDIFFANINAEKFINDEILKKVSKIIVNQNFYLRNNILKNTKIVETNNFESDLIFELQKNYHIPSKIITITGTKGKTSSCWYAFEILRLLNLNVIYIGTIGSYFGTLDKIIKISDITMTTPDIADIYRLLNEGLKFGAQIAVIETSSHGLGQGRLNGLKIDVAGFTNFSHDHLDYHKTLENYFNSKMLLFNLYKPQNIALNDNLECLEEIKKNIDKDSKISYYGKNSQKLIIKETNLKHQIFTIQINGRKYEYLIKILCDYQIDNILCALQCVYLITNDINVFNVNLSQINPPPGRMERIDNENIFIDYAHSPDSLYNLLNSVQYLKEKIILIFGCGGNRDKQKRPIMGYIANCLANEIIITSDNSRTEESDSIIKDILDGINGSDNLKIFQNDQFVIEQIKLFEKKINKRSANPIIIIEQDREMAIKNGVNNLNKDSILLIVGKGHEKYQIFKDKTIDFDDLKIAQKYIKHEG